MKEAAVIIGASSGLGRALAYRLAESGTNCIIAARNERDLIAIANDLTIRFDIAVHVISLDLAMVGEKNAIEFSHECFSKFSCLNQVYITSAIISDKDHDVESSAVLNEITMVNFIGVSHLIAAFSHKLSGIKANITIISSIAVVRSRGNNVAYAASKAALEYYVKGLQHFYAGNPMRLQIYRTGYMETSMSQGKKLFFPKANTHQVARYLVSHKSAVFRLKYYPRYWRLIAIILTMMPWFIYRKIKF